MTTVASCARSVNDLHYALLRHPLRSPRQHVAVTSECCARVTSRFSLLDPLFYRENRCNSTSKHILFLRVVGAEAEWTIFITATKCILREVRFEAEEILQHQTSSVVGVKRRDRDFKIHWYCWCPRLSNVDYNRLYICCQVMINHRVCQVNNRTNRCNNN
jgi:predicted GNAT family acetyltransferase